VQRVVSAFDECAVIAANYGMADVLDNLVITLCKFTHLTNAHTTSARPGSPQPPTERTLARRVTVERVTVGENSHQQQLEPWATRALLFGQDDKAQMALSTLARLMHEHAYVVYSNPRLL